MKFFRFIAEQLPEYRALVRHIKKNKSLPQEQGLPVLAAGLSHVHKAHFLAALCSEEEVDFPFLVLVETENEALRLCDDINVLTDGGAALYPAKDLNLSELETLSGEYEHKRLEVLSNILEGKIKLVLATPEAAGQLTIPPEVLSRRTLKIEQGSEIALDTLASTLVEAGFTRCEMIEGAAQFSVRGAIVDIFPVNSREPVRLEFWGDTADNIGFFDKETQRRTESVKHISIAPSFEVLLDFEKAAERLETLLKKSRLKDEEKTLFSDLKRLKNGEAPKNRDKFLPLAYDKRASLFDYISFCVVCENVGCQESYRAVSLQHEEDLAYLFERGQLCKGLDKYILTRAEMKEALSLKTRAYLDTFMRGGDLKLSEIVTLKAMQLSSWSGEYKLLTSELSDYFRRGYAAVVFAGTEKAARTLAQDLKDDNFPVDFSASPKKIYAGRGYILEGTLSAGYDYPEAKCVMLTYAAAQAAGRGAITKTRKKKRRGEEIRSITDINAGDYIVHQNYGIGIFECVTKLTDDNVSKDYIKIRYAGTDVLYAPVTQLDMISRYIGNTDAVSLKLNKLNSDSWQKAKTKAKAAAGELAEELIALYSKRLKSEGFKFSADNTEQVQFENHFSFIETDDQLRCIEEIKADMQTARPMDRLLCGDVGFGKTEVALRGAFKCVMDGKQCALLCPTTVLAWQHYQTAIKRMEGFPVNIELLSRFRSNREIKQVLEKVKKGIVDLVIGTHRLVQSDVVFKNLGLVIIDEEQRFGVGHKEKFKEMFSGVDILTLSATPIPRTLNMAMSGIRDMSVINTPPQDRQPVTTYVIEQDMGVVAQAINKELRRNGQVYYIHNRIETITDCAAELHKLCPEAKIGIAHGRISEDELLEVWRRLLDGEIDVLVCTTLIETGVDVPNVNTLIIENADHMGLAQLHQLRGRVGRTNRRAFAYFMFRRGKVLSEIATKRLNAIREFTQFGSGFNIAMRDLEIRGAGSILGARQSGHLSAVGYDMYLKLLNQAVSEKKGLKPDIPDECLIDVKSDAYIPDGYISNSAQRISCYKRIAEIRNEEDALDVTDELIDRYGEPPKPVMQLVEAAQVRNMAQAAKITEIIQDGGFIKIRVPELNMAGISAASGRMGDRVALDFTGKYAVKVKLIKGESPLSTAREFLEDYSRG